MFDLTQFSFAYGGPLSSGVIKSRAEDFMVTEKLGWHPEGEGEHIYLDVTKKGENTAWVAKQIAKFADVKESDVGYCGLKDRNAITRQWFSVYRSKGVDLDWSRLEQLAGTNISLHEKTRGTKKLRRGDHLSNDFEIVVRNTDKLNLDKFANLMESVSEKGVPNYFGEQRFGVNGNNLVVAQRWLEGGERHLLKRNKHFIISAARSFLFNLVLSHRVEGNNWTAVIDGEACLENRPTAPLWGRGKSAAALLAKEIEDSVLAEWASWRDGLEHIGLKQERRPLAAVPENLQWQTEYDSLTLKFSLPIGCYATSVLRELVSSEDPNKVSA